MGTSQFGSAATVIDGLDRVRSVVVGTYHSCALRDDGTVWCWGGNAFGQLGDGTTRDRREPAAVRGLGDVRELATGSRHVCALRGDGSVWCWGAGLGGQLGDGMRATSPTPVRVRL